MTELEMFNSLLLRNPLPGVKIKIERKNNIYYIPGWVFNSNDKFVTVSYKNIKNRFPSKFNLTGQIIYDILILGLTDINDRPRCPICGKEVEYDSFYNGYRKTCGDKSCISAQAKEEVTQLWKDEDYKNRQSQSHIEWAMDEENKKKLRERTLAIWKNEEYRNRQSRSHVEWAKNEANREQMRNISKQLWRTPEFLKKMMNRSSGSIIRGTESSRKTVGGIIIYDSSWERDFIRFCNACDEICTINRANFSISYIHDQIDRQYFPDFLITTTTNRTMLVEIKSDWLLASDERTAIKISAGENYVKTCDTIDEYVVLLGLDLYENLGYNKINETKIREKLKLI